MRVSTLDAHLSGLAAALLPYRREAERLAGWGAELAWTLARGGRLLVAGNGGSAAEAQHLTAELVGKLRDDREPLSAIALHADTSALTAIGNDYGYHEVFARQVRAHGRADDILLLMSTSGTSTNLLTAAHAGRDTGLRCWAFTGPTPNPLADLCEEVLAVPSPDGQVVQELHLVSTHLLCEYVEQALPLVRQLPTTTGPAPTTTGTARWPGAGSDGQADDDRRTRPVSAGWTGPVLAGIGVARATPGRNGHGWNGPGIDGHAMDGHGVAGHGHNGHGVDGHALNGHGRNDHDGHSASGHGTNGDPPNRHARDGRPASGDRPRSTGTGWVES